MATPPQRFQAPSSSGGRRDSVGGIAAQVGEGKWFQAIDERYLLPLFSNATASRTFHARRARRNVSGPGSGGLVPGRASASASASLLANEEATPRASEDEGLGQDREIDLRSAGRGAPAWEARTQAAASNPSLGRVTTGDGNAFERRVGSPILRTSPRESERQADSNGAFIS